MSQDSTIIAESISRIFAQALDRASLEAFEAGRWPESLWALVQESGFDAVLLPEAEGGTGGGWNDALPILYAAGYYRAPIPLAETLTAKGLLSANGLPVPAGISTLIQQGHGNALQMRVASGQLILDGHAGAVPWAAQASGAVVAGDVDGRSVIGYVAFGSDGARVGPEPGHNLAHEPRGDVHFEGCACQVYATGKAGMSGRPVLSWGALARAIAMAGALASVQAQTVQYAKEREQFGRPLGKFQAVRQMLAVIATEAAAARAAVGAACAALDRRDAGFEIGVAKMRAGQAAGVVCGLAHQIHGAMGFTHEHSLHYGTSRLWSWRDEFGNEATWASEIGKQAVRAGGDNFWKTLTARTIADLDPM